MKIVFFNFFLIKKRLKNIFSEGLIQNVSIGYTNFDTLRKFRYITPIRYVTPIRNVMPILSIFIYLFLIIN